MFFLLFQIYPLFAFNFLAFFDLGLNMQLEPMSFMLWICLYKLVIDRFEAKLIDEKKENDRFIAKIELLEDLQGIEGLS